MVPCELTNHWIHHLMCASSFDRICYIFFNLFWISDKRGWHYNGWHKNEGALYMCIHIIPKYCTAKMNWIELHTWLIELKFLTNYINWIELKCFSNELNRDNVNCVQHWHVYHDSYLNALKYFILIRLCLVMLPTLLGDPRCLPHSTFSIGPPI